MFGKRPKKLDPRIRYQHQSFTKKLDQARHYKREPQTMPEDWQGYILAKLGLNSKLSQALAVVILLGIIYLIFIPSFLSAKNIIVAGLGQEDTKRVEADVRSYISEAPFYLAQHNVVFLNKNRLAGDLLRDNKIYKVNKVNKRLLSRTIEVSVEMKAPRYVALRNNQVYSIYNDGSVQEQLAADPGQWLSINPGTIKIKDEDQGSLSSNTEYLSEDLIITMNQILDRYKNATNNDIDYFIIPSGTVMPLQPDDITVFVKKPGNKVDYKVIFDVKQNWDDAFAKLKLLFSQMPQDRYAKLVYVDLRFEQRAFLCLSDAPCAREPDPVPVVEPPAVSPTNPEIK